MWVLKFVKLNVCSGVFQAWSLAVVLVHLEMEWRKLQNWMLLGNESVTLKKKKVLPDFKMQKKGGSANHG